MNAIEWLGWLPLFPLLGFVTLVLFGNRFSTLLISWIGVGSVGLTALLAALIGTQFMQGSLQPVHMVFGRWLQVADLSVNYGFYLDALAVTMLLVVTGVGFLIHVYAVGFMASDPDLARFFAYMNLFIVAMLVLVLADNLVLLYLGWEGVGLGSYLLIGFWYQDPNNGYAARKAFVMTRIGDTAMILGLFLLFTHLHTLDIQQAMQLANRQWAFASPLAVATALLLLGGAVGKSAQLPLQSWLPDAMVGPTPVSALIHASTMVTAGVYLIARTHALFELAPSVQFLVAVIGGITLILAGCSALVQTDIKRILAYSTISQIGYMFLALGVGAWSAAIFHLLTHAFFKALLFLAAGAIIHCFHHEHNIFKMGGLRNSMPMVFWCFMIGSAALSGLTFTSGYYSKHEILLAAYPISPGLWLTGTLGALLTGLYSFRLVFVAFLGKQVASIEKPLQWSMTVPLLILSALALGGALLKIPLASVFIPDYPEPLFPPFDPVPLITSIAPFIGVLIAVLFYITGTFSASKLTESSWIRQVQNLWASGWAVDTLYNAFLVTPYKNLANFNKNDVIDSVYSGISMLSRKGNLLLSASQTGQIRWYAGLMVFATIFIIALGWLP